MELNLPFEIVIGIGITLMCSVGAAAYFGIYYFDMKNKHPELHVFQKARKSPFPPVVAMVDPSGRFYHFNAEKERKQDCKLKKEDYGLLLDPNTVSKMPRSRLEDGTQVFMYGAGFHFPVDPNGARTIVQLVAKIRKEYPKLNFIRDDIVLLELLTKSGTDLPIDIANVMKMYPLEDYYEELARNACEAPGGVFKKNRNKNQPAEEQKPSYKDISVDQLAEMIEEIKGKLKTWHVEPGYFSMHEGMSLLPIGTMSSDMKRLETITKINTMNDMAKEQAPWDSLVRFFLIIMAAIVISWMVISAMKAQ